MTRATTGGNFIEGKCVNCDREITDTCPNCDKPYNNDSLNIEQWTTKKLKEEAIGYDQLIFEVGCYGSSDLQMLSAICNELDKRGVDINSKINF
jgi:hypothetical protein